MLYVKFNDVYLIITIGTAMEDIRYHIFIYLRDLLKL